MTLNELVITAVTKIDNLIIERGGRELGELGLNGLHRMLTQLVHDGARTIAAREDEP